MYKILFSYYMIVQISILGFIGLSDNVKSVFICKGKSSERYHLEKNCRGLKNCSTDIAVVTLEEARKIGRTLCKWED